MATTGGSDIQITADSSQATRSLGTFFRNMERSGRRVNRVMNNLNPFDRIEHEANRLSRTIGRPIANLPDHLRPFREEITEVRTELNQLGRQGGQSIESLSRAAARSSVTADRLTSVSSSGKKAAEVVRELTDETRTAQLAVMGLNEDGTIAIDTDESQRRLRSFRSGLDETRRRLEALRDAGDMGSYVAGMRQVEMSLADVDRSMQATARGGRQYTSMLRRMGIYTSDTANEMAINMERMRHSFMSNLDMMNARSTLSSKMMDFLPETSRIQQLDRFFLGISNGLERIATRGSAANLAVEMLGRNAPMKKIMDLTRMIQQGVMGVQQLTLGASVVFGIFTGVMAKAASGPSPSKVAEDAGKALAEYHDALKERADAIMNTWSIFEDVQMEAIAPWKLKKNLSEQVDLLRDWESNLNELSGRINNVEIMDYLRGLGPEAAMEISALNDHTETGLAEWVGLFEEKSKIATRAAMTELEWMRHETDLKIKAMQDSLTPLSIAWENFQQTWTSAMGPFVNAWGIIAAKVVDGVTAVGAFIEKMNELSPQLSAMAGMFAYVASGLFILLAPLGVGIGLLKGMRANFNAIYLMLKPAVVAFFRVAGAVTVVSAAIVALGTIFYNLWTNSENLRNAIGRLAEGLRNILSGALKSLKGPIDEMKASFNAMTSGILGEGKTMSDFWTVMGDLIARVIVAITDIYLPAFAGGIGVLRDAVVAALHIMVLAFDSIREWWAKASPLIMPYINMLFGAMKSNSEKASATISKAFQAIKDWWDQNGPAILNIVKVVFGEVSSFVGGVLKKIVMFFASDGAQLMQAASNVFEFIGKIVKTVFNAVWEVVKFVWPLVLWLIESVWKNIQGVINGGLNIIMGLVRIFSGLFTGDFAKMWEGIKQLFFGAVEFIFNLVSLTFYGKILSGARLFITMMRSSFTSMWTALKALFSGSSGAVVEYLKRAWSEAWRATSTVFKNIWTYLKNTWDSLVLITRGFLNTTSSIFTVGFPAIRNFIMRIWDEVLNFFSSIFIRIFTVVRDRVIAIETVMRNIFTAVFNFYKNILTTMWTTTQNIFNSIFSFIRNIWTAIRNFLSQSVTNIWTLISAGFRNIRVSIETISRSIHTTLTSIWTTIRNFISSSVGAIHTRVKNVWSFLKNDTVRIFGQIVDGVKSRFASIVTAAKELPGKIGSGIKSMAGKVTEGITALINRMSTTLGKGMNGVIKGINWVLDKLNVDLQIEPWVVPQYAHGTKAHPGGPAMINDGKGANAGPELIIRPDGTAGMVKGKNVVGNFEEGTQVISAKNTRKLLASIPAYNRGKGLLNSVIGKGKEVASNLWEGGKNLGKKVVSKAFDIFDYIKNPSKLLDVALETLGIDKPSGNGFVANMAKGGWNKVKSGAVDFVKSKLADFGATQSGISLTGGNGGGFGAPFRFTSGPGPRNTGIPGASTFHKGWDWAAPIGTPIPSVTNGVGHRTGWHPLSGNFVEVRDASGKIHRYQHNSRNIMKVGQPVTKGQTVGLVGDTGVGSGAHVHYEVKRGYAKGGIINKEHTARVGEGDKKEVIIPLEQHRERAVSLWRQAGDMLGMSGNTLAVLYNDNATVVNTLKAIAQQIGAMTGQIVKQHPYLQQIAPTLENLKILVTQKVAEMKAGVEGIDLWKQVSQYFGFDTDSIFNQGQDRVDYSGAAVSSIINKVPGANGSAVSNGSGFKIHVEVKPAPLNIDGQHVTDILFDHVDSRFVGQAETEDYFKGRTK